jgi:DnaJ-class molecular chaperone
MTNIVLPEGHTFSVKFNSKSCGRCGGTGKYYVGGSAIRTGVCFKCNGAGRTRSAITARNSAAYGAYLANRPRITDAAARAQAAWTELHSGAYGRAFTTTIKAIESEVAINA